MRLSIFAIVFSTLCPHFLAFPDYSRLLSLAYSDSSLYCGLWKTHHNSNEKICEHIAWGDPLITGNLVYISYSGTSFITEDEEFKVENPVDSIDDLMKIAGVRNSVHQFRISTQYAEHAKVVKGLPLCSEEHYFTVIHSNEGLALPFSYHSQNFVFSLYSLLKGEKDAHLHSVNTVPMSLRKKLLNNFNEFMDVRSGERTFTVANVRVMFKNLFSRNMNESSVAYSSAFGCYITEDLMDLYGVEGFKIEHLGSAPLLPTARRFSTQTSCEHDGSNNRQYEIEWFGPSTLYSLGHVDFDRVEQVWLGLHDKTKNRLSWFSSQSILIREWKVLSGNELLGESFTVPYTKFLPRFEKKMILSHKLLKKMKASRNLMSRLPNKLKSFQKSAMKQPEMSRQEIARHIFNTKHTGDVSSLLLVSRAPGAYEILLNGYDRLSRVLTAALGIPKSGRFLNSYYPIYPYRNSVRATALYDSAVRGNFDEVLELLSAKSIRVNKGTDAGESPLMGILQLGRRIRFKHRVCAYALLNHRKMDILKQANDGSSVSDYLNQTDRLLAQYIIHRYKDLGKLQVSKS